MKRYILLVFSAVLLFSIQAYPQFSGPSNQIACLGDTAVFTVEHSFDYITFSWEESTDNLTFTPIVPSAEYSGIESNVLLAFTGIINPSSSGIWRYYRCHMYSNIYGWDYSETAYLEINRPPVVEFTWDNPCEGQTVHFESVVGQESPPFKYHWSFEDAPGAVSVYPSPSYQYAESGLYLVSLTVTNAKGCQTTVTKEVEIFDIPSLIISGKEVVCSNELDVKYSVDLAGENVHYEWDISGFGTIEDNTLQEISIDWNAAGEPIQTKLMLTVTIDPSGCSTQVSEEILITTYVAPPEGTVFRKPNGSSLLIYHGPDVNSYRWGYTDGSGADYYIPADQGGERLYCDFDALNPANDYWVETSYDSRINCVTRSYFDFNAGKTAEIPVSEAFAIYPVPATGHVTLKFDENMHPSGINIYNLMMQMVYENNNLTGINSEYRINTENLKSGIYIIRVTSDQGISNYRVFTIEK